LNSNIDEPKKDKIAYTSLKSQLSTLKLSITRKTSTCHHPKTSPLLYPTTSLSTVLVLEQNFNSSSYITHKLYNFQHNNSSLPQTQTTMKNFAQYYDSWYIQFNNLIHQLKLSTQTDSEELIQKVLSHHQDYYNAKSMAAEKDPLHVLASPWATSLERSLHWIAGWRPTTAFHLIYTESSLLFESHIIDILRGFRTGDLGDLSPNQFRRVSDLQCDTVSNSISHCTFNCLCYFLFFSTSSIACLDLY